MLYVSCTLCVCHDIAVMGLVLDCMTGASWRVLWCMLWGRALGPCCGACNQLRSVCVTHLYALVKLMRVKVIEMAPDTVSFSTCMHQACDGHQDLKNAALWDLWDLLWNLPYA